MPTAIQSRLNRWSMLCLLAGLLACVLLGVGAVISRPQAFRAYLIAFLFWSGVSLGTIAILTLHHLTGGRWGLGIRPILETAARTVPLIALMFVPLLAGLGDVYHWMHPAAGGMPTPHKNFYFTVPFFIGRAALYFLLWIIMALVLGRESRAADPMTVSRMPAFSAPAMILWGVLVTLAAVDWAMSLEEHWFSSIYGMTFMVGQALCALCMAIVVAAPLSRLRPFDRWLTPSQFNDLGNLLLTLVILWAYLAFGQYLIIWSGNLKDEVPWYLHRGQGPWRALAIVLIVFHFAVPFALLLTRQVKRRSGALATVAGGLLVMHWLDMVWLVEPAFAKSPANWHTAWMDLAAPIGIGGIWVAAFLFLLGRSRIMTALSAETAGTTV